MALSESFNVPGLGSRIGQEARAKANILAEKRGTDELGNKIRETRRLTSSKPGSLPRAEKMNVRHERIVKLLSENGEASVHALSDAFAVSAMTIRRDLLLLEQAGRLTRTHGGAVLSKLGIVEFAFERQGKK